LTKNNKMNSTQNGQQMKRNIAYKHRIGKILSGKPLLEAERLKALQVDNQEVVRVNIIANIIDKYIQDGEKKFASVTLDDGTGQIKLKLFGEDIEKFASLNQGDTVISIGLVRHWNNEIYVSPEIIKKKDPSFLLIRKLEAEIAQPKNLNKEDLSALKNKMLAMIREAEKNQGIEIEEIILELKEPPEIINHEIKKLLEEGIAYEPRPGRIRYLG